ncbi:MAG: type I-A CRISPR-associated protein Cas4/Csa1 [Desulfurispora sp.]|uniref:type I-A CRISPR-associated protein Cas4/Csa1 n=1 Tax=Desulfurispora sp. TaxID=3014275 RepID=UPI00404B423E
MYFLTEEEKKYLLRHLVPRARHYGVAEELRGWNWHQPPLLAPYEVKLGAYEVAGAYCPTHRDLYLRRVAGVQPAVSLPLVRGKFLHRVMADELVRAKRLIYTRGAGRHREILQELLQGPEAAQPPDFSVNEADVPTLLEEAGIIAAFERQRLASRIQEILVKEPHVNEDSLVNLAVPVVVEQKINGTFLGLSAHLNVDACLLAEQIVMELKFGERKKFHRLQTTAYALAMEAVYEFPVNLGCIVYARFKNGRLNVERDLHIIDDELRQWFIEERDAKMRLVEEAIDPGIQQCYETCPYYKHCC